MASTMITANELCIDDVILFRFKNDRVKVAISSIKIESTYGTVTVGGKYNSAEVSRVFGLKEVVRVFEDG